MFRSYNSEANKFIEVYAYDGAWRYNTSFVLYSTDGGKHCFDLSCLMALFFSKRVIFHVLTLFSWYERPVWFNFEGKKLKA